MDPVNLNAPFYVLANGVDPNSPFPVVTVGGQNYNLVPAAFLANPTGSTPYVVDQYYSQNSPSNPKQQIYQYNSAGQLVAVANTNSYLVVPVGFTLASTAPFITSIQQALSNPDTYFAALTAWYQGMEPAGSEDLQRNYEGVGWDNNPNMFVLAFQHAANWYYGFAAQQSGLGVTAAIGDAQIAKWLQGQTVPQIDIDEMNAGAAFGTSLGKQGSNDTVIFALSGATTNNGSAIFPGNIQVTLSGSNDTLQFTGLNDTLTLAGTNGTLTLSGSATVVVGQNGSTVVQTGNGNNTITSTIPGLTIDLGTGNNDVGSVAIGTIVNAQPSGDDQFELSADELITGSTANDELLVGGTVLHGAVKPGTQYVGEPVNRGRLRIPRLRAAAQAIILAECAARLEAEAEAAKCQGGPLDHGSADQLSQA